MIVGSLLSIWLYRISHILDLCLIKTSILLCTFYGVYSQTSFFWQEPCCYQDAQLTKACQSTTILLHRTDAFTILSVHYSPSLSSAEYPCSLLAYSCVTRLVMHGRSRSSWAVSRVRILPIATTQGHSGSSTPYTTSLPTSSSGPFQLYSS